MAKRRNNDSEPVSLFPFMSILASLIGILTLMISVSISAKQMENNSSNSEEDKARAVENRDLTKQITAIKAAISVSEDKLKTQNKASFQIAELRDKRIALEKQLKNLSQPVGSEDEIQKTIANLRAEMEKLKQEQPKLNQSIAELKKELTARKNPPKKTESIQIRPGNRVAARLFFVECHKDGINLIDENDKITTIATNAIRNSPEYKSFLKNAKGTRDSMVLFLIRSWGASSYNWAVGIAETEFEVRTGKLPMPNNGKIDLSVFRKK